MSVSVGGAYVWGRQVVEEMDPRMASQGQRTECQLCCTTVPSRTFVKFLPCEHEACSSCMHDLRKSAIHKASQGVTCPYCRSYVDRYKAKDARDAQTVAACEQASAVAERAAKARNGIVDRPRRVEPVHVPNGWPCSFCGNGNLMSTQVCQKCGKPKVDVTAKPVQEGKDLLDMTTDELRNCAMQNRHPRINIAFEELGLRIVDGKCPLLHKKAAMQDAIAPTLACGGATRFMHVARSLASPFCMKQLSYHFCANYFVQLALCAAAAIRDVLPRAPNAAALDPGARRELSGLFGLLLRSLARDYADMSQHPQASHVLDCLMDNATPTELLDIADEVGQSLTALLATQWGFKTCERMLGRVTDLLHNDALHQDVVDTLGYICDYASADAAALAAVPLRIDNFKVLATLLRFAVPSQGALWLADEIAKVVPRLLFHADGNVFTVGLQCLQLLLQLEPRNQLGPPCLYRDMVCLFALRIKGNLARLLSRAQASIQMIKTLLNRFETDQEAGWLDHFLQELIQGLCEDERLLRMDHLTTLMAQMLASPLFGDRYVTDLLEMTASLSEDVRAVLEEKLSLYRIPGAALPDPLYYKVSCLQPTALDDLITATIERPPPPPPRPGLEHAATLDPVPEPFETEPVPEPLPMEPPAGVALRGGASHADADAAPSGGYAGGPYGRSPEGYQGPPPALTERPVRTQRGDSGGLTAAPGQRFWGGAERAPSFEPRSFDDPVPEALPDDAYDGAAPYGGGAPVDDAGADVAPPGFRTEQSWHHHSSEAPYASRQLRPPPSRGGFVPPSLDDEIAAGAEALSLQHTRAAPRSPRRGGGFVGGAPFGGRPGLDEEIDRAASAHGRGSAGGYECGGGTGAGWGAPRSMVHAPGRGGRGPAPPASGGYERGPAPDDGYYGAANGAPALDSYAPHRPVPQPQRPAQSLPDREQDGGYAGGERMQHAAPMQPTYAHPAPRQPAPPQPAPAQPARAAPAADAWTCAVCTYKHDGNEALFLTCGMCGTPHT